MTADVYKVSTEVVVTRQPQVEVAKTFVILTPSPSVAVAKTYSIMHSASSIMKAPTYVVLAPRYVPGVDVPADRGFIGERFPACLSFGSSGGPGFKTSVFELDSGYTASTVEWDQIRARYDVTFDNATVADMQSLERFFYTVRGSGYSFRYKDWSDYQISKQILFVGDGETTVFQMFKRYSSGGHIFDRPVTKLYPGSFTQLNIDTVVKTAGIDFFVNDDFGTVHFDTPPAKGSVGEIEYAEFDVPVRFNTDSLPLSFDDFDLVSVPTIPLIEVR